MAQAAGQPATTAATLTTQSTSAPLTSAPATVTAPLTSAPVIKEKSIIQQIRDREKSFENKVDAYTNPAALLQRGQEMQKYADETVAEYAPRIDAFMSKRGEGARSVVKDIKTGTRYAGKSIYKFGELSYEIAGQGTPYVKGVLQSVNSSMPYKLVFLFLFFAVFYNIIYRICVFFGIDVVILNMYLGWVSFILVLFTFLPYEYGNVLDTPE
jgi:hypothetical protein